MTILAEHHGLPTCSGVGWCLCDVWRSLFSGFHGLSRSITRAWMLCNINVVSKLSSPWWTCVRSPREIETSGPSLKILMIRNNHGPSQIYRKIDDAKARSLLRRDVALPALRFHDPSQTVGSREVNLYRFSVDERCFE